MKAIILAAGRGGRLREHNAARLPKCLLEIGGKSLLARSLAALESLRIDQVDLVVGFEADYIIDHVGGLAARPPVAFHFNPHFDQGSVISLLAARETLEEGLPVIIMDADVLHHPGILQRLVSSDIENCFLLDRDFEAGEEPVKIVVHRGAMVEFRKQLPAGLEFDVIGESVGFFRFGGEAAALIAAGCARYESEGLEDSPHEEVLRDLLLDGSAACGFEDVTGLAWVEIDFPQDVQRAEDVILPAIRLEHPAF